MFACYLQDRSAGADVLKGPRGGKSHGCKSKWSTVCCTVEEHDIDASPSRDMSSGDLLATLRTPSNEAPGKISMHLFSYSHTVSFLLLTMP